jgi:hypothetical protein
MSRQTDSSGVWHRPAAELPCRPHAADANTRRIGNQRKHASSYPRAGTLSSFCLLVLTTGFPAACEKRQFQRGRGSIRTSVAFKVLAHSGG